MNKALLVARLFAGRRSPAIAPAAAAATIAAMSSTVTVRGATAADESAMGRLGAMLVEEHHRFRSVALHRAAARRRANVTASFWLPRSAGRRLSCSSPSEKATLVGYVFGGMEGNDYMALRGPAGVLYDLLVDPGAPPAGGRDGAPRRCARRAVEARGAARRALHGGEESRRAGDVRWSALSPDHDRDDARALSAICGRPARPSARER